MEGTPYETLQAANQRMRESFREYEEDCRKLIKGLSKALIDYLQCSASKVRWLPYAEDFHFGEGFIETAAGRRMALFDDTSYRFVLMIDFRPGELAEGGWVYVQLSVRRSDRHFVVRLADREETVEKGDEDQVAQLAEAVFESVLEYLETDFESFLEGAERPRPSIGFITRS